MKMNKILATTDIHGNFGRIPKLHALMDQLSSGKAENLDHSQMLRS